MKDPIPRGPDPTRTDFLVSCYHTPSALARRLFLVVLRVGHLRAAPDYAVQRDHLPGHDLLFCLNGAGYVWSENRRFPVRAGEVAWISGYYPHGHGAHPDRPWELLWLRVDGSILQETWNLLSVGRNPVFRRVRPAPLHGEFRRIIDALTQRPATLDALLNAAAAEILALLFESRQAEAGGHLVDSRPGVPPEIQPALTRLSLYLDRPWRVSELAESCRMSAPHFFRRFKQATGSSPIDYLRRERINQARRRLLQSNDSVQQIAEQVGYHDAFYFSRDFKHHTGVSPKYYRQQHAREA